MWMPEVRFKSPAAGNGLVVNVALGSYRSAAIFVPTSNGGLTIEWNVSHKDNKRYSAIGEVL